LFDSILLEVNTRSRARADREVRRTIEKQRRIERRELRNAVQLANNNG
jgi:hypothetical protein